MAITPHSLIAGLPVEGTSGSLRAVDPRTGEEVEPTFSLVGTDEVAQACEAAAEAFDAFRSTTPTERADLLEAIADAIEARRDEVVERAVLESGLPVGRETGELGRTTGQLRMFADVVRRGDHLGVRIDPAQPDRQPAPRPDVRQRMVALGPVAVFGASNFPLAFSTAGGDTASALAAGCPVVYKGHEAHPGTTVLVAEAVTEAVSRAGLPAGVFSAVLGAGYEVGRALVTDPHITAVGFTGSRAGGLALMRAAAGRPVPIPVHAEMSSVNPVVVLPGALVEGATALAASYVGSLTLGSGQFCTNPGLVLVPTGADGDAFVATAGEAVAAASGQTMLTPGIARAYADGTTRVRGTEGVEVVAEGTSGDGANAPAPGLVSTTAGVLARTPDLQDEVFGATSLVVRYDAVEDLLDVLEGLEGQLTATVQYAPTDTETARAVLPVLERKVGRILFNGWPTGVEVNHAMVHGGPFPASSDPRTTSVGSLAIERFQRPVAYQDVPPEVLPPAVADDNPWGLARRVDGTTA